jgi:Exportin-T
MTTVQEVEQWILHSNDPTHTERQRQAVQCLQAWIRPLSADDPVMVDLLWQLWQQTNYEIVQFYVLSAMQQYFPLLSLTQHQQLRINILSYPLHTTRAMPTFLRNKVAALLALCLIHDTPPTDSTTTTVKGWSTVTEDMTRLASQSPELFVQILICLMDDFLLASAAEDGRTEEAPRSSGPTLEQTRRCKDVLKGNYSPPSESLSTSSLTLLQYFFATLIQIYESALPQPGSSSLVLLCVRAIRGIFQWTSMEHLGDSTVQRCLQLMLFTVRTYSFQPKYDSNPHHIINGDIYKATIQAFQQWVTSCTVVNITMNSDIVPRLFISSSSSLQSIADPKLPVLGSLMEQLHGETKMIPTVPMTSVVTNCASMNSGIHITLQQNDDDSIDAETMEAVIEVAALVNTSGLELLPLYEQYVLSSEVAVKNSAVEHLFHLVMDLLFRFFAYDDIDVASAVLPFAIQLSLYMEEDDKLQNGTLNPVMSSMARHLPLILGILYNQMKYPIDFAYDYEDEKDAEEEIFRTELCQVYKKLIRSAPARCLQFVGEILLSQCATQNVAAVATPEIEASLRLLYHYCEAIRPAPGLKMVMKNDSFCAILRTLHNSNIAYHPHPEVLCLYYETAVRYYPIYLTDSGDLLARLLGAMTGSTGLQHIQGRVRSRCCYLLLRLVKATISLLRPYVETAVTGIESLLSNQQNLELRTDDTLFLFETIGLLLGQSGLEVAQQQQWIAAVITPHVQTMERYILMVNSPTATPMEDAEEQYGELLSNSIAAITNLSKGFTNPSTAVAAVLTETLDITLRVLQALPHCEPVRNKAMVLLQRMIVCVGKNVLASMSAFLRLLISHCTNDDVLFVSQIFNQLCIKFKEDASSVIDSMLLPFLQKCEALVPTHHEVVGAISPDSEQLPPHIATEQLAVRKLTFVVLQHIVSYKSTSVLFSATNASHLEIVLQIMNEGISAHDFTVQKTCLRFFRVLLEQLDSVIATNNGSLSPESHHYRKGIVNFICQIVLPTTFNALMNSPSVSRDANGGRVISELGQLLHALSKACNSNLTEHQAYHNSLAHILQQISVGGTDILLPAMQGPATTVNDIVAGLNQLLTATSAKRSGL